MQMHEQTHIKFAFLSFSYQLVKVEDKIVPANTMKAYRRGRSIAPLTLNLSTRR
jgi:hypothetical protein